MGASCWARMRDTAPGVCNGSALAGISLEAVSTELGSGVSLPAFVASPPTGLCELEPWFLHL